MTVIPTGGGPLFVRRVTPDIDPCPPHGIDRPDVAALQEDPDPLTAMCRDALADIRAQFAAAHDRAALWNPTTPGDPR